VLNELEEGEEEDFDSEEEGPDGEEISDGEESTSSFGVDIDTPTPTPGADADADTSDSDEPLDQTIFVETIRTVLPVGGNKYRRRIFDGESVRHFPEEPDVWMDATQEERRWVRREFTNRHSV